MALFSERSLFFYVYIQLCGRLNPEPVLAVGIKQRAKPAAAWTSRKCFLLLLGQCCECGPAEWIWGQGKAGDRCWWGRWDVRRGCVDAGGGRRLGEEDQEEEEGGAGGAAVWSLAVSSCKNAPSEPDDTYRQNNLCVRCETVKWALFLQWMVLWCTRARACVFVCVCYR